MGCGKADPRERGHARGSEMVRREKDEVAVEEYGKFGGRGYATRDFAKSGRDWVTWPGVDLKMADMVQETR